MCRAFVTSSLVWPLKNTLSQVGLYTANPGEHSSHEITQWSARQVPDEISGESWVV